MRKLRLVGLSADGQQVVFVDDGGAEYGAPADDRLRAALRGDRARLGQLEIEMDSVLRPRDIQARIRAGESPDAVASLAQVSVDKIMPFCVPVLAERQHMAELARRSHVRQRNAEGPSRRLADVVTERLRGRSIDPESASWDAWRRDDGRWSVGISYRSGERERSALFVFDAVGRYSIADDDEAKWLTGERQSTSKGPQPRDGGRSDSGKPSDRRLSAVPTGDDLLSLSEADEETDDLTAVVRAVSGTEAPSSPTYPDETDSGAEASQETIRDSDSPPTEEREEDPVVASAEDAADPVTEPTPEPRRRGARRASVPSWDEIMFGKSNDS